MDPMLAERVRALHPRVGVGNDSPAWLKPRRTIYGPTLDGRYCGHPRCRTFEGALRKAEALSRALTMKVPLVPERMLSDRA